jgi:DNA helicase-2/ATP-dependent DNA helicase PcrA
VVLVDHDVLLRGLDPQQRHAVATDASPLVIIAAAGSGKTTVLTRRIARRIADGSADAAHVLALTFTRDAAGELRRRLRRLDIRDPIESGTFHAVALRLLRDRALAAGTAAPVIVTDRLRLVREVLTETKVGCEASAAMADIDWARARLIGPDQYAKALRDVRRRSALTPDAYAKVLARYEALKRRRGVVDFDDLLVELLAQLRRDATFADIIRWRFRHLFVDEVQDLNPLQFAVLEQIRGGRPDVCLVGDPRQAIYGWNGADPTMLADIEHLVPGITVVNLTGNYRCSPQIVRAGAAALSAAKIGDDSESRRGDGRMPKVLPCADELDEAATVVRLVRDLAERHGLRHVGVLARTNEQLVPLARALAAAGFPVDRSAGTSPLDRAVAEVARLTSRDQLAAWAESVWAEGAKVDPLRTRVAEEVDRFLSSGEGGSLRSWVEARQPFDDLDDDPDGAVSLLTFHAAKGREWRAVVVTGAEAGLVPHASSSTPAQRAEESRLFYVALTRAGDELVITWARRRKDSPTGPSPWLEPVMVTLADEPHHPPPPQLRRLHAPSDPLAPLKDWRAGVARAAGVADRAVCSDQVLRSLLADPPTDTAGVAARLGVGIGAAERLAPKLLSLLAPLAAASGA